MHRIGVLCRLLELLPVRALLGRRHMRRVRGNELRARLIKSRSIVPIDDRRGRRVLPYYLYAACRPAPGSASHADTDAETSRDVYRTGCRGDRR